MSISLANLLQPYEITSLDKSTPCFPHKPKERLIRRHVTWLLQERQGLAKFAATILKVIEVCLLCLSIVGLPLLYQAIHHAWKIKSEEDFFRLSSSIPKPDSQVKIEFKTKRETFNHTHEFIIQNAILWTRKKGSQLDWKPVYYSGKIPMEFSSDGSNLIVLDENRRVHYKKILREYRQEEGNPDGASADKSTKNNWKDRWFSLPYLHHIVNVFIHKHLYIASEVRAWAISHRGFFNNYLEDGYKKHYVYPGCSTLYVLELTGKFIRFFDPWSPKHSKICIPLPESETSTFVGDNMSASASTLMVIGYESKKDDPLKTLKIYTRLADIDSMGWNPGFKYDYFPRENEPDVQVIPLSSWREHSLPQAVLDGKGTITQNIMIIQTGEGNSARRMFVDGTDEKGMRGVYYKNIEEEDWKFQAHSKNIDLEQEEPLSIQKKISEPFSTTVHHYNGVEAHVRNDLPVEFSLDGFGKGSEKSILNLSIEGKAYQLPIYPKKTLWNFIGFEGDSYDLVIPQEFHTDPVMTKLFNGQRIIPVRISEGDRALKIVPSLFSACTFSFTFGR